jgi:hypothetical protein
MMIGLPLVAGWSEVKSSIMYIESKADGSPALHELAG